MMYGWGMGWMWFWPVLIVIGLLIVASAVGLWMRSRPSIGLGPDDTDSARRILDERFARGEIDEDEYHRRREQLR